MFDRFRTAVGGSWRAAGGHLELSRHYW